MKQPLFYWVFLASCILGLGDSFAQFNYNDYQKGESIVNESFDSANPKWELDGFQISSGWLTKSARKGLAMLPVFVDQKRDFEMEVLIQFNAPVQMFQEIIFGDYLIFFSPWPEKVRLKYQNPGFSIWYDPRPGFLYNPDPKYIVHEGKDNPYVGSNLNLITLRKINSNIFLFINKEMVAQTPFKPFVDSKVGVFATMHNPSIDFINLNYLEKAVAAQTLTATADESISQSNYDDYQKSEAIMSDNFNSTNAKWELSKSSIEGGWLTLDGQSHAIQYLPVDQQRNFEFETSLQYNKNDLFSSIFTISFGDYFVLPASYDKKNNGFSIWQENVSKPGKFKQLMDWRKFNFINSTFYLFTFRKIGPSAYFLINNELVATFLYKQQPSFKIAIGSRGQQQLMVDYVRLNYLVKEAAPVLNDKVLEVRTTEPSQLNTSIKPGGKYYGLIIGVSNYEDVRLSLDKPTKDATKLKEILTNNYSFTDSTTFLLLNPTRQKLMAELFRLRKVVGPNDNLLIFYAGHGYWDDDAKQGYWWAADAHTNDASFWLSNSDVREQIRSIKAGHTLLISDACFSGGIFKARGAASVKNASLDLQILYRMPSRRAITSGTMTTVPDQSVFFEFLSKRLLENQSPYLSSQQLFDSFRLAVINNSMTVPQDGVIAETGDEGGDFIFIRKN